MTMVDDGRWRAVVNDAKEMAGDSSVSNGKPYGH